MKAPEGMLMTSEIEAAAQLKMIEDHLTCALEIAERSGETLIAALVGEAVNAVVDRFSERRNASEG